MLENSLALPPPVQFKRKRVKGITSNVQDYLWTFSSPVLSNVDASGASNARTASANNRSRYNKIIGIEIASDPLAQG